MNLTMIPIGLHDMSEVVVDPICSLSSVGITLPERRHLHIIYKHTLSLRNFNIPISGHIQWCKLNQSLRRAPS